MNANESNSDKFKRLAVARTNRALQCHKLIANLASAQYDKEPEQVEAIFGALQVSLDAARAKFDKGGVTGPSFTL